MRRALALGMQAVVLATITVAPGSSASAHAPPTGPTADEPPARSLAGLALDTSYRLVLFGGYVAATDTYLQDTWTWDGTAWTEQHPLNAPAPRYGFQMAFDPVRRQTVLFGGYGANTTFSDTWTWDGANWTQQHPADHPPIAAMYGMAYHAVLHEVIVFMGDGLWTEPMWAWDGATWTQVASPSLPSPRSAVGLSYDGARRRLVMFGGRKCGDICDSYRDTWTWNGSDWTMQQPASAPSRRSSMGMGYDAARQRVVLFGGSTTRGLSDETWLWDGRGWQLQAPANAPRERQDPALAWDGARRVMVLFGGAWISWHGLVEFGDTWTWDGFDWTCVSACS